VLIGSYWDRVPAAVWRAEQLTTSAVASQIASPPTDISSLAKRLSRINSWQVFYCLQQRRIFYPYSTLTFGDVRYCHINLLTTLTLTQTLTPTLTLTLTLSPKPYVTIFTWILLSNAYNFYMSFARWRLRFFVLTGQIAHRLFDRLPVN